MGGEGNVTEEELLGDSGPALAHECSILEEGVVLCDLLVVVSGLEDGHDDLNGDGE